jgi:hypothetical protein
MARKNSAITNTNTNTNINKINISIPKTRTVSRKPKQTKQTQEEINSAEEKLSNLENMDGQFVNPSVFGFNRTPLYIPEPIQNSIQNRVVEQPSKVSRGTMTSPMNLEEQQEEIHTQSQPTSPISFSSVSPVQAEIYRPRPVSVPTDKSAFQDMGRGLSLPSDFQARLSRQEGFQPVQPMSSPFSMYQNPNLSSAMSRVTSMNNPPNINELRTRMFGVKPAGVSNTTPLQITQGTSPIPELEPKPKNKGGRPKGVKNKPKPVSTATGASAPRQGAPTVEVTPPIVTIKRPKAKKGLRNQPTIEEID